MNDHSAHTTPSVVPPPAEKRPATFGALSAAIEKFLDPSLFEVIPVVDIIRHGDSAARASSVNRTGSSISSRPAKDCQTSPFALEMAIAASPRAANLPLA